MTDPVDAGPGVTAEDDPQTLADEFIEYAEWDWIATPTGSYLHHLAELDDPLQAGEDWGGPGRLSCGAHSVWVTIPGLFSRMGGRRCPRCCKRLGILEGTGSPKNDDALRPFVAARVADRP